MGRNDDELCHRSGREWNVMEETYLIDQIKKYVSYVSVDFEADMRVARCVSDLLPHGALWRSGA